MTPNGARSDLPFLHRNRLDGLQNAAQPRSHQSHHGRAHGGLDGSRPAKKRRLSRDCSSAYDPCLAARDAGLPAEPGHQQRALLIDVRCIQQKDASDPRSTTPQRVFDRPAAQVSKARCKVTIHSCENGVKEILFCASQICVVKLYKNTPGPGYAAKIQLPEPFIIPADTIMLERVAQGHVFDLADCYVAEIELAGAGDPSWPPEMLVKLEGDEIPIFSYKPSNERRLWALTAVIEDLCTKSSVPEKLFLSHRTKDVPDRPTDLVLEREVLWTTGFDAQAIRERRLQNGAAHGANGVNSDGSPSIKPTVTTNGYGHGQASNGHAYGVSAAAAAVAAEAYTDNDHTNGVVNGDFNGHVEDEEYMDGEVTPNRSLRTRGTARNYNLKELSDKAAGIERKKRSRLVGPEKDDTVLLDDDDSCSLVYKLPAEDVVFEGLVCCVCGALLPSTDQLNMHFLCHPQYRFEWSPARHSHDAPLVVVVSLDKAVAEGESMRPKVYQLSRPNGPLDLNSYMGGDDSWVTSRYGPENGRSPTEYNLVKPLAMKSSRPRTSEGDLNGVSSGGSNVNKNKNINNNAAAASTAASTSLVAPAPATATALIPTYNSSGNAGSNRRAVVPHIKQRLFHPLSKALLEPGQPVPGPTADNEWLIQKHRDHLQDFVDIDAWEKEYMTEWDSFMFKEQVSSNAYIVRALLAFVRAKAAWLLEKKPRMLEFGKHIATLKARGSIRSETVEEAFKHISEVRRKGLGPPPGAPAPSPSPKKNLVRSKGACVLCHKPARGPLLLICSNKACLRRTYHSDCVRLTTKIPVENKQDWQCNDCAVP